MHAAPGYPRECLNDGPVSEHVGGKVYFTLRRIDQLNVYMFEIFRRGHSGPGTGSARLNAPMATETALGRRSAADLISR
jgi:hypothetical protein